MRPKANQVPHENETNDTSQIIPTDTNLPTSANLASREPPCVSNQHNNRSAGQTSPIDPVPLTSHNQDNAMPKKTEVTQHSTAKDKSQIVPAEGNLPGIPRLKLVEGEDKKILAADTTDLTKWLGELANALASNNYDVCMGMLRHIAIATSNSPGADAANAMLSFIAETKPRDQIEARLAMQMDAVHDAVMKAKRRLDMAKTEPELDREANRLTKFVRASCGLVLTYKNYHTAGPQTVTVQNVSVSDGGQAIVGNVTQTPRGTPPAADLPPVTINGTALPLNDNEEQPEDARRLGKGERK